MAPSQTLKWLEGSRGPASENVEIEGTEPYIVGGHTASGYWVDNGRRTTVKGLFAAGDVAGGCPQKYVTGALAEGEIAAESMTKYLKNLNADSEKSNAIKEIETKIDNASILKKKEYEAHLMSFCNTSANSEAARFCL